MRQDLRKQNANKLKPLEGDLHDRFFIIYGPTGTGKSSSISYLFPNCYKKQKGTDKWDLYDNDNPDHKIVWIDEMSKETLETLTGKSKGGFEFLKELCDRYPVTVDGKYMASDSIRPEYIYITMNEHPNSLLPDRAQFINQEVLHRKINCLTVHDWLLRNNLRLKENGQGVEPIPRIIINRDESAVGIKRECTEECKQD